MLDFSFKSVLTLLKNAERGVVDFAFFKCDTVEEFKTYLDWLTMPKWVSGKSDYIGIKEEDREKIAKAKEKENAEKFDIYLDFDAYAVDFLRFFNIDLWENETLSWFKFKTLLHSLFYYEDSVLSKRMSFRNYKSSPKDDKKYRKSMEENKKLYSLSTENTQNAIENMMESLKRGAN